MAACDEERGRSEMERRAVATLSYRAAQQLLCVCARVFLFFSFFFPLVFFRKSKIESYISKCVFSFSFIFFYFRCCSFTATKNTTRNRPALVFYPPLTHEAIKFTLYKFCGCGFAGFVGRV